MNPSFRPRRPIGRRTRSRSINSSSSDSVKVDPMPSHSLAMSTRGLPPLHRTRTHSHSPSPPQRHAPASRPRYPSNDRLQRGHEELKNITIDIRRNISGDNTTYRREIVVNPHDVVVVRRPGEGSRPLFDRDEFKNYPTEERRVVKKSASPTKSDRSDRKERRRERERSRRARSRSRTRSRSRSGRHLIDQRYVHKLRRTRSRSPRNRRRSRSRSAERRRERDRHGRSREHSDYGMPGMVPMYPVPLRPRLPIYGPVMPYPRPFLRPIVPLRAYPRLRMYIPRGYPPFRPPI